MNSFINPKSEFLPHYGIAEPEDRAVPAIIVVDRCALFREGLARVLNASGFAIATLTESIAHLKVQVGASAPTMIIIGDIKNEFDDISAFQRVHSYFPTSKVVFLRQGYQEKDAAVLYQMGVAGILPVPTEAESPSTEGFILALELVLSGQKVIPMQLVSGCMGRRQIAPPALQTRLPCKESVDPNSASSSLSGREVEILRYLLLGESNRGIAQQLMISEATVKVHVKSILRKINVGNRTKAAIWALENLEHSVSREFFPSTRGSRRDSKYAATTNSDDCSSFLKNSDDIELVGQISISNIAP